MKFGTIEVPVIVTLDGVDKGAVLRIEMTMGDEAKHENVVEKFSALLGSRLDLIDLGDDE